MVGRKLFNNVKNQVIWASCIALVTVAVVGLFLTDVPFLGKEERQAVTVLPPTTHIPHKRPNSRLRRLTEHMLIVVFLEGLIIFVLRRIYNQMHQKVKDRKHNRFWVEPLEAVYMARPDARRREEQC
jgi:cytochrome b subunit of formate dehydrogenase